MNRRMNLTLRYGAVAAVTTIVGTVAATPAYAADDDVKVVNTETVQVYMSPTGKIDTERVYEQLAMTGNGTVTLKNPISTDNLRNLDGFGGFDVKNGEQITKTTVDGEKKLRSVSDFKGDLPLDVSVAYRLDGKNVKPGDVVGEDGRLEVEYTVKNVTGAPQEVSFPDGKGGTVTKTVEVPIPVVGSLSLVAPSSFKNVSSKQANIAGDGKGGTKLSFTMTLFPPIGSTTAVFGYTADITDGVVPRAEISALPVNPLEVPSFKSAGESYKGGADTGAELTAGATTIDTNLLKLRDGAADLLAGLIKLRDGAGELNAGLAGEAAPGSQKLANGAGELATGLGQINSGAKRLSDGMGEAFAGSKTLDAGANKLRTGASDLGGGLTKLAKGGNDLSEGFNSSTGQPDFVTGTKTLAQGLGLISGGLDQLADPQVGVPAAAKGARDLRDGVDRIRAGVSNPGCDRTNPTAPSNPCGLLEGLQSLRAGFTSTDPANPGLIAGATQIQGGLQQLLSTNPAAPGVPVAKGGVDQINQKIAEALGTAGTVNQLAGALGQVRNFCNAIADPVTKGTCLGTVDTIIGRVNSADDSDGVESLREQLLAANGGLDQVSTGLGNAITGITALETGAGKLKAGLQQAEAGVGALVTGVGRLQAGLSNAGCDPLAPQDPANPCGLREGLSVLIAGMDKAVLGLQQLAPGGQDALSGANELAEKIDFAGKGAAQLADGLGLANSGSKRLAEGTGELVAGTGTLRAGLGQLDDGAGQLSDGAAEAADGSGQLATGADQLADGLKDAANGSGQLADGLGTAAGGAPKLVDGAQRLSDEGTKKLVEAGTATAQSYGEMYATMTAGAERANTEKMAFGAPEDAVGLTAYNYILKGDDGESGRNWARGLGGLAVLGAGAGVFALRRRFI